MSTYGFVECADFSATWNSLDPSRETPIVSRTITLLAVDDARTDSGVATGAAAGPNGHPSPPSPRGHKDSRAPHFTLDDVMSGASDSKCTSPSGRSWPKREPRSQAETEILSPEEEQRTPRDGAAGRGAPTSYVRTFMNRCGVRTSGVLVRGVCRTTSAPCQAAWHSPTPTQRWAGPRPAQARRAPRIPSE